MQSESSSNSSSSLYVRQSSGLVREASVLDAIIFNTVFSAPVGATLAFPLRHPDLYRNSPANVRIGGVPLLPIVSVLSILVIVGLAYLVLSYQQPGINTAQLGPLPGFIFMGSLIVIGLVIFYVARFVRARQGINLDLIYSELPPE